MHGTCRIGGIINVFTVTERTFPPGDFVRISARDMLPSPLRLTSRRPKLLIRFCIGRREFSLSPNPSQSITPSRFLSNVSTNARQSPFRSNASQKFQLLSRRTAPRVYSKPRCSLRADNSAQSARSFSETRSFPSRRSPANAAGKEWKLQWPS